MANAASSGGRRTRMSGYSAPAATGIPSALYPSENTKFNCAGGESSGAEGDFHNGDPQRWCVRFAAGVPCAGSGYPSGVLDATPSRGFGGGPEGIYRSSLDA
eukprot:8185041-Pyramimonas_sp.AAC.1